MSKRLYIVLGLLLALLVSSCEDSLDPKKIDALDAIVLEKANIDGLIVNEKGLAIPDVFVYVLGTNITTATDSNGIFRLKGVNIPNKRCVVRCYKRGCVTVSKALNTELSKKQAIQIMMASERIIGTIQGNLGGRVNINLNPTNPAFIEFQAGCVVNAQGDVYTGNVNVFGRYLSPAEGNFGRAITGSDLYGRDFNGKETMLNALGVIELKLESSNGESLQLREGKYANISIPIPQNLINKAQQNISLWFFDELIGAWREDGSATKNTESNAYIGKIKHLSTWGVFYNGEKAMLRGKVLDCNNEPVFGAVVNIDGLVTTTDTLGNFAHLVPANIELKVNARFEGIGSGSDIKLLPKISPNKELDCGVIKLPCPTYLNFIVSDCNQSEPSNDVMIVVSFNDQSQIKRHLVFNTSLKKRFTIPVLPAFKELSVIADIYDKRKTENVIIDKPNVQRLNILNFCNNQEENISKIIIERTDYSKTFLFPDSINLNIPRLSGISFRDSTNNSDPETYRISTKTIGSAGPEFSLDFHKKVISKKNNFFRMIMVGFDKGNAPSFRETQAPIQDSTLLEIEECDNKFGGKLKYTFRLVYKDELNKGKFIVVSGIVNTIFEKVE